MSNDGISRLGHARPAPVTATSPVRPAANQDGEADTQREQAAMPVSKRDGITALQRAVQRLEQHVKEMKRELRFSIDEVANRVVVSVVDGETGELIRQIPGEEALRIARNLATDGFQLLDGVNQRA